MLPLRLLSTAIALVLVAASATAQAPAAAVPDSVKVVDVAAKPDDDLASILKAEFAKARAMGRTPFVELGAAWCGSCKSVAANLGDKRMRDAFTGTYIIRLDVDQWKKKLTPVGLVTNEIPAFFPIDDQGKAIGPVKIGDWGEDTPENMAPALKKFFSENLQKKKS